jgi:hypothetical protein
MTTIAAAQIQTVSERFLAQATYTTSGNLEAQAPITLTIDRFSTDADRAALVAAVKHGGTSAARQLLATNADVGAVQVGSAQRAIKYAYARPTAGGRVITLVTATPIPFINTTADAPNELGLILLVTGGSEPGHGELVSSAKIRVDEQGAIVTDSHAGHVIPLSTVVSVR